MDWYRKHPQPPSRRYCNLFNLLKRNSNLWLRFAGSAGPLGQRRENAMLCQKLVRHFIGFPRAIRSLRLPYQFCVVKSCTLLVSRMLRCLRCTKQFPISSRFVPQCGLKRLQSFSRALGIEQHFAQQLACGNNRPGHYRVYLSGVFLVGSLTQQSYCGGTFALPVKDPCFHHIVIDLNFCGPESLPYTFVLNGAAHCALQLFKSFQVILGEIDFAESRFTESAREDQRGFSMRKDLPVDIGSRKCQGSGFVPPLALDRVS